MNWQADENKALIKAILALNTTEEAKRFLRDLLTETEIVEFAKRFKAARLLNEQVPYSIIEKETGLSSRTVARVAKWLNRKDGGYKMVISRLHQPLVH